MGILRRTGRPGNPKSNQMLESPGELHISAAANQAGNSSTLRVNEFQMPVLQQVLANNTEGKVFPNLPGELRVQAHHGRHPLGFQPVREAGTKIPGESATEIQMRFNPPPMARSATFVKLHGIGACSIEIEPHIRLLECITRLQRPSVVYSPFSRH